MKNGNMLRAGRDIIDLLDKGGYITPDGDFNDQKFNDLQADATFASGVEAVLVKYGVAIPSKVQAVVQLLPVLAAIIK
jgi:hypothetical protein